MNSSCNWSNMYYLFPMALTSSFINIITISIGILVSIIDLTDWTIDWLTDDWNHARIYRSEIVLCSTSSFFSIILIITTVRTTNSRSCESNSKHTYNCAYQTSIVIFRYFLRFSSRAVSRRQNRAPLLRHTPVGGPLLTPFRFPAVLAVAIARRRHVL